jgi:hypothetical protein
LRTLLPVELQLADNGDRTMPCAVSLLGIITIDSDELDTLFIISSRFSRNVPLASIQFWREGLEGIDADKLQWLQEWVNVEVYEEILQ